VDWHDCRIGEGAKGQVKRAQWKGSIQVAIKADHLISSAGDKLTDEMQLFLDLHHPHIVSCYGLLK
jgi:serine/threonine protein kinase